MEPKKTKVSLKKVLLLGIVALTCLNLVLYLIKTYNTSSNASIATLKVHNKKEIANHFKYMSKASGQYLVNYNTSFLTLADFLSKTTTSSNNDIYQLKLSSLNSYNSKSQQELIDNLKYETNIALSVLSKGEPKKTPEYYSELIDAFIISESISCLNYNKEVRKLFKQMAVVFDNY